MTRTRAPLPTLALLAALSGGSAALAQDGAPVALQFQPDAESWTGGYAGVQFGLGKPGDFSSDNPGIGGVSLGYDRDLGETVVGMGVDYDRSGIALSGGDGLGSMLRLRGRIGYDMGRGLPYVTAGAARATLDSGAEDTGYFVGVGYDYRVTPEITVGGEVLIHRFDDLGPGSDPLDITTAQMRAAFRF